MINYELAKELNDAGFPYQQRWNTCRKRLTTNDADVAVVPTLSELIEACGERIVLHAPHTVDAGERAWHNYEDWFAEKQPEDPLRDRDFVKATGKTPEEAAARLWLALNKK